MYNRGGEFLKWAIVVFIGQDSFPQQAVKQFIDNVGAMTKTIFAKSVPLAALIFGRTHERTPLAKILSGIDFDLSVPIKATNRRSTQ
jgi:hypothetical protein